jgi:ribulose-phosphate 3-epimerase
MKAVEVARFMKVLIAPSILSSDLGNTGRVVRELEKGGADLIHLDVMDGRFVPNITFGPDFVAAIRSVCRLPLEAHLMVADPIALAPAFADAGVDRLTVHVELGESVHAVLDKIRELGLKAAVSLNPDTPVDGVLPLLDRIDLVLAMTVQPGFGGQAFRRDVLPKISRLRREIEERAVEVHLEVDGGIGPGTAAEVVAAGADVLVAGSFITRGDSIPERIKALRDDFRSA